MKGQLVFSLSKMLEVIIVIGLLFGIIAAVGNISITNINEVKTNVDKLSIVDSAHSLMNCLSEKPAAANADQQKIKSNLDECRKSSEISFADLGIYSDKDKIEKMPSGSQSQKAKEYTLYSNLLLSSKIRQVKLYVQK